MLLITCPYCGVTAEETEFAAGGEAHIKRYGPGSNDGEIENYLFYRKNPAGVQFERWRHIYGCGKWFHVARSTTTLEIFGTYPIEMTEPPQYIWDEIMRRGAA